VWIQDKAVHLDAIDRKRFTGALEKIIISLTKQQNNKTTKHMVFAKCGLLGFRQQTGTPESLDDLKGMYSKCHWLMGGDKATINDAHDGLACGTSKIVRNYECVYRETPPAQNEDTTFVLHMGKGGGVPKDEGTPVGYCGHNTSECKLATCSSQCDEKEDCHDFAFHNLPGKAKCYFKGDDYSDDWRDNPTYDFYVKSSS